MEEKKVLKQDIAAEEYKKELEQKTVTEDKLHKNIITKINKRFLLLILALIVLGIGLYFVLRETGVINKYAYEEVDNLAEREGVCFDNLLFSYIIVGKRGNQWWHSQLCIMNNGDVYVFVFDRSNNNRRPWNTFYEGDEKINENSNELHSRGYDETNWEKMEDVVYLGRFSDRAVKLLISYVDNYDLNAEYYLLNPPQMTIPNGEDTQQEREAKDTEDEELEWISYAVTLYWHEQPEKDLRKDRTIEYSYMHQTWWGGYEKEIQERSLDENAIAAIELFESSGFYDRWVKMCLNGY